MLSSCVENIHMLALGLAILRVFQSSLEYMVLYALFKRIFFKKSCQILILFSSETQFTRTAWLLAEKPLV